MSPNYHHIWVLEVFKNLKVLLLMFPFVQSILPMVVEHLLILAEAYINLLPVALLSNSKPALTDEITV